MAILIFLLYTFSTVQLTSGSFPKCSLGCYYMDTNLIVTITNTLANSPEFCQSYCGNLSFEAYSVSDADCFCNTLSMLTKKPYFEDCDWTCPDKNYICGGTDRVGLSPTQNVYAMTGLCSSHLYQCELGCFPRAANFTSVYFQSPSNTPQYCQMMCSPFEAYAVWYDMCYCGTVSQLTSNPGVASCGDRCPGTHYIICGGNALKSQNVYTNLGNCNYTVTLPTTTSTTLSLSTSTTALTTSTTTTTIKPTTTTKSTSTTKTTSTNPTTTITTSIKSTTTTTLQPATSTTTVIHTTPATSQETTSITNTVSSEAITNQSGLQVMFEQAGIVPNVDEVATTAAIQDSLSYVTANLPYEKQIQLGYTQEEIIFNCIFDSKKCAESDFKLILDPIYGNCYSFNYFDPPKHSSPKAGAVNGLKILLHSQQSEYSCSSDSAGFQLAIDESTVHHFPDNLGFSVPSGYIASISISKKVLQSLSYPYSNCLLDKNENFDVYDGRNYTVEGCLNTCSQKLYAKVCGCLNPKLVKLENANFCSLENKQCVEYVSSCLLADHVKNSCKCPSPCSSSVTHFTVTVSELNKASLEPYCSNSNVTDCSASIRSNFSLLIVYFESLNIFSYVEVASYSILNLFNDFSAVVGLLLGIGAMVPFEILGLCISLCRYVLILKKKLI